MNTPSLTPQLQRHSGDSYGFRFVAQGKSVVYSTDSEHKLEERAETERFVAFFRDADLVIFDAMYSLADAISVEFPDPPSAGTTFAISIPRDEAACGEQVIGGYKSVPVTLTNGIGQTLVEPTRDSFGDWADGGCVLRFAWIGELAPLTNEMSLTVGSEVFPLTIEQLFSGQDDGPDHVVALAVPLDDPLPKRPVPRGTSLVGTDIEPGVYAIDEPGCYWERLSGLSGDLDDILANANTTGRGIAEVLPTDVAFHTTCGPWREWVAPSLPVTEFGEGDWSVGHDIKPGVYRSQGNSFCYWERSSGFTHAFGEIKANNNVEGDAVVEISASDVRFTSSGCNTWTKAP